MSPAVHPEEKSAVYYSPFGYPQPTRAQSLHVSEEPSREAIERATEKVECTPELVTMWLCSQVENSGWVNVALIERRMAADQECTSHQLQAVLWSGSHESALRARHILRERMVADSATDIDMRIPAAEQELDAEAIEDALPVGDAFDSDFGVFLEVSR